MVNHISRRHLIVAALTASVVTPATWAQTKTAAATQAAAAAAKRPAAGRALRI
jgi:hypothetical protein